MMVTEDSRESDVLGLIGSLHAQEKEIEEQLTQVRSNIDAAQLVLSLLREQRGLPAHPGDPLVERVRGMTHMQALITIADANDGVVRVREAKRILLQSGLKKNPKTAAQGITSALVRSDRFEHTGKGEYTLTPDWQRKLTALTARN